MRFISNKKIKEEMFGKASLKEKVDKLIDIIIEKFYCVAKEKKPDSEEEKDDKAEEIDICRLLISLCELLIECFENIETELGISSLGSKMKTIRGMIKSLNK